MLNITNPSQLPAERRKAGLYAYLDSPEYNAYWLHALSVAHKLLDAHAEKHGRDVYYQDNFGADFIAAIEFDLVERPVQVQTFEFVGSPGVFWRDMPMYSEFTEALKQLESSPRGSQIHVYREVSGQYVWGVLTHAGGGSTNRLEGGAWWIERPTVEQGLEKMLAYEAYLARQQAQKEREWLANFSRIRELKLSPGMELVNVASMHDRRTCYFSFRIAGFTQTGYLQLTDGKLKGSPKRFEVTLPASQIEAENLRSSIKESSVAAADGSAGEDLNFKLI